MDLCLAEPAVPAGGADGSDTAGRCPPGHGLGIHPKHPVSTGKGAGGRVVKLSQGGIVRRLPFLMTPTRSSQDGAPD